MNMKASKKSGSRRKSVKRTDRVNISFSAAMKARIDKLARRHKMTRVGLIGEAIERCFG